MLLLTGTLIVLLTSGADTVSAGVQPSPQWVHWHTRLSQICLQERLAPSATSETVSLNTIAYPRTALEHRRDQVSRAGWTYPIIPMRRSPPAPNCTYPDCSSDGRPRRGARAASVRGKVMSTLVVTSHAHLRVRATTAYWARSIESRPSAEAGPNMAIFRQPPPGVHMGDIPS